MDAEKGMRWGNREDDPNVQHEAVTFDNAPNDSVARQDALDATVGRHWGPTFVTSPFTRRALAAELPGKVLR